VSSGTLNPTHSLTAVQNFKLVSLWQPLRVHCSWQTQAVANRISNVYQWHPCTHTGPVSLKHVTSTQYSESGNIHDTYTKPCTLNGNEFAMQVLFIFAPV